MINFKGHFETPSMPNFIKVCFGEKHDLDEAIATGESNKTTSIDVALLDDEAVEQVISAWAQAFRSHVKNRRNK